MSVPNSLQKGDFFPFIKMSLINDGVFDMMNITSSQFFLFVTTNNLSELSPDLLRGLTQEYIVIVVFTGEQDKSLGAVRYTRDSQVLKLLDMDHKAYLVSPNRRIVDVTPVTELENTKLVVSNYVETSNIPYLVVENVLDDALLDRIVKFYTDNKHRATVHNTANKHRYHVHPDRDLEIAMDNKLSRSLFPEIRKIFYFDVQYRENYKICGYDAADNGRFRAHRDTPEPYGHRRYAMSLCLNDDYEGGEFELPEYGLSVKLKKNAAFIFPGICSHQVKPITKGTRMTIISFFTNKSIDQYKVRSDFFRERQIEYSKIYPVSQTENLATHISATQEVPQEDPHDGPYNTPQETQEVPQDVPQEVLQETQ